MTLATMKHN